MSVITKIGTFFKNNGGKILCKGVGLGALGYVAYDAHYLGKLQADLYASERDARAVSRYLNNDMYTSKMSKTQEKLRHKSLTMEMDFRGRRIFNSVVGYIKGFVSMMVSHVVPLGLGALALFSKSKKVSKLSVLGLGVYAGLHVLTDFFGLGTPKNQSPLV